MPGNKKDPKHNSNTATIFTLKFFNAKQSKGRN